MDQSAARSGTVLLWLYGLIAVVLAEAVILSVYPLLGLPVAGLILFLTLFSVEWLRTFRYQVSETLLTASCGIFFIRQKSVAWQHVRSAARFSTPLLRAFHLCILRFSSANGSILLPMLSEKAAEALLERLKTVFPV